LNFICTFPDHNVHTNLDKDISALLPTSFFDFIMQTRRAHALPNAPLGTSAALAFVTLDYIHGEKPCRIARPPASSGLSNCFFDAIWLFLNHLRIIVREELFEPSSPQGLTRRSFSFPYLVHAHVLQVQFGGAKLSIADGRDGIPTHAPNCSRRESG
jgi:hypothetical protein